MHNKDEINIIIDLEKILRLKINHKNGYPYSCLLIRNELYNNQYKPIFSYLPSCSNK